jgi:hypothetical protein
MTTNLSANGIVMIGYPVSADLVGVKAFSTKTEVFFLSDTCIPFCLWCVTPSFHYCIYRILHRWRFVVRLGRAFGGVLQNFTNNISKQILHHVIVCILYESRIVRKGRYCF